MNSAIEAGARALREQWPHIFVLAGERADQMAQAVLAAAQQTEGIPVVPGLDQELPGRRSSHTDQYPLNDWGDRDSRRLNDGTRGEPSDESCESAPSAEAEKLRQTANANEFQRKWEAAEQRVDEAETSARLERRRAEESRRLHHRAAEDATDRDRLQRELDEQTGRADCLQIENDRLKLLLRYGSEKCHDALRGLYKLVDRHGWISGLSKETRDVVLAKARDALGEGPGRKQSY